MRVLILHGVGGPQEIAEGVGRLNALLAHLGHSEINPDDVVVPNHDHHLIAPPHEGPTRFDSTWKKPDGDSLNRSLVE